MHISVEKLLLVIKLCSFNPSRYDHIDTDVDVIMIISNIPDRLFFKMGSTRFASTNHTCSVLVTFGILFYTRDARVVQCNDSDAFISLWRFCGMQRCDFYRYVGVVQLSRWIWKGKWMQVRWVRWSSHQSKKSHSDLPCWFASCETMRKWGTVSSTGYVCDGEMLFRLCYR